MSCRAGERIATVATIMDPVIVRLEKAAILRVIHQEPPFSEMFIAHLLLGLIDYNGCIEVHSSLLNVVLHDEPHINI
jgi:hypothetical protein